MKRVAAVLPYSGGGKKKSELPLSGFVGGTHTDIDVMYSDLVKCQQEHRAAIKELRAEKEAHQRAKQWDAVHQCEAELQRQEEQHRNAITMMGAEVNNIVRSISEKLVRTTEELDSCKIEKEKAERYKKNLNVQDEEAVRQCNTRLMRLEEVHRQQLAKLETDTKALKQAYELQLQTCLQDKSGKAQQANLRTALENCSLRLDETTKREEQIRNELQECTRTVIKQGTQSSEQVRQFEEEINRLQLELDHRNAELKKALTARHSINRGPPSARTADVGQCGTLERENAQLRAEINKLKARLEPIKQQRKSEQAQLVEMDNMTKQAQQELQAEKEKAEIHKKELYFQINLLNEEVDRNKIAITSLKNELTRCRMDATREVHRLTKPWEVKLKDCQFLVNEMNEEWMQEDTEMDALRSELAKAHADLAACQSNNRGPPSARTADVGQCGALELENAQLLDELDGLKAELEALKQQRQTQMMEMARVVQKAQDDLIWCQQALDNQAARATQHGATATADQAQHELEAARHQLRSEQVQLRDTTKVAEQAQRKLEAAKNQMRATKHPLQSEHAEQLRRLHADLDAKDRAVTDLTKVAEQARRDLLRCEQALAEAPRATHSAAALAALADARARLAAVPPPATAATAKKATTRRRGAADADISEALFVPRRRTQLSTIDT